MKSVVLSLVAGSAFGFAAQPVVSSMIGGVYSYTAEVRYDLPVEVDAGGAPKSSEQLTETRRVLAVPGFYGDLTAVTQQEGTSILWYRDGGGTVRNVSVDGAAGLLYSIEKRAAGRVSVRATR